MRSLVVSPFLPEPLLDGGRVRIRQLLRGLARHHDVELLALAEPAPDLDDHIAAIAADGVRVEVVPHAPRRSADAIRAVASGGSFYGQRFASGALARLVEQRLATHPPDVVQCEFAYTAQYRVEAPAGARVRWVLDEHNVEHRLNATLTANRPGARGLPYRVYARRELARRRAEELAGCRAFDRVVTVSELDRDRLLEDLPGLEVSVIPNGVDTETVRSRAEVGEAGAVFVGKLDFRPNVDGLRWFCDRALPRLLAEEPGFVLRVVGSRPGREVRALERHAGVELVGEVDDVRPYLEQAAVAVVPLLAGSGTRLKVLEAMAMRRPVVATTLGAEGIAAEHGEHLLLADEPAPFAAAVVRLLGDRELRRSLGAAGRALAEERYSWPALADRLAAVHRELSAG